MPDLIGHLNGMRLPVKPAMTSAATFSSNDVSSNVMPDLLGHLNEMGLPVKPAMTSAAAGG